ncbi:hypothetical protein ACTD5D_27690 [Nocardia takedensis]|uniref:hypothetical protein n=1 Tax=Nocardia takedensis TaxID=259390 RepID=UPI000300FEC8|nr:hypothetical protein [Nocardia takedensis]
MDPHLPQDGRLRVGQWATGNVGAQALRAILDHPDLRLVGVLVHDRAKVGRDAGELCGTEAPTGVCATAEIADILAAQPDCVLYIPRLFDADQVCALLAAGIDVAGRSCFRSVWYCRAAPAPGWTTRETGWHLTVAGETPVELFLRYDAEPDRLAAVSPRYAANRAVNAVTALRAAPPGIRTTRDLPAPATRFC